MVGDLNIGIAGQQANILFLTDQVLLQFSDYKSVRKILAHPLPGLKPVGQFLGFSEIGLRARVGNRKPFELFPRPGIIVRWFSPAVRELVQAAKS